MAGESDQGERSEEATQQRRDDFRKRGQVAQTKELSVVLLLFASIGMVYMMSKYFFAQIHEVFTMSMGDNLAEMVRTGEWHEASWFALQRGVMMIAPVLGMFWVLGFASTVVQIGFLQNEDALQFDFNRIDPVAGLKRIFSLKSLIEGFKSLLKVGVIMFISYLMLKDQLQTLPHLMYFTTPQIIEFLGTLTVRLLTGTGFFMLFLTAADYMFQRWELEKEMRMTKQEIREEVKSREGDPLIKARIKRVQREIAGRRMMEDVPKADVIVTNPTHIAVALKYNDNMVAPQLIAKGADLLAQRIKDLAREHNIPIVENKPLARTIFKTLKIGQGIPRELYTAVAEVLSYVYKLKKKVVR
jgi:flagellar biosynthetic protein FlhB